MNTRIRAFLPFLLIPILLIGALMVGLPGAPHRTQAEDAPAAPIIAPLQADDATPIVVTVEVPVTVEVTRIVTVIVTPTFTPLPPTPTPLPPDMTVDDDHFIGSADAPVKVVEFSDYRCGFCRRFYSQTLFTLTTHYGDLIQFVYRDFPIFGQESINGALAAECSGDQGKFWEYHNLLFDNEAREQPLPLVQEHLAQWALDLDLDLDAWTACFTSEAAYNEVVIDAITAQDWGVTGTPTFFINGKALVGAQPLEVFIQVIDRELTALGIEPPEFIPPTPQN